MVLYNGQFDDGGGDFVCFGLSEGYPEFRFDVGSGPAVIRGNRTLDLNQWHTVKLTRNRKKGRSYYTPAMPKGYIVFVSSAPLSFRQSFRLSVHTPGTLGG